MIEEGEIPRDRQPELKLSRKFMNGGEVKTSLATPERKNAQENFAATSRTPEKS